MGTGIDKAWIRSGFTPGFYLIFTLIYPSDYHWILYARCFRVIGEVQQGFL